MSVEVQPATEQSNVENQQLLHETKTDKTNTDDDDPYPQIFVPEYFSLDTPRDKLMKLIEQDAQRKILPRTYIIIALLLVPSIALPIAYKKPEYPLISINGVTLLIIFVLYFGHLMLILFIAYCNPKRELYRLWTLNASPDNWINTTATYSQLKYENRAIQSVSEFSAIGGSIMNNMLMSVSMVVWTLVMVSFAIEMHYHEYYMNIDDILLMIGAFGLLLIGIFEYDPFNACLRNMHVTGTTCGACAVVAFLIQSIQMSKLDGYNWKKIIPAVIIAAVCLFGWIYWQRQKELAFKYYVNNKSTFDIKIVSKYTMKCQLSESIFLMFAALAVGLWLINYPFNCNECNYDCRSDAK